MRLTEYRKTSETAAVAIRTVLKNKKGHGIAFADLSREVASSLGETRKSVVVPGAIWRLVDEGELRFDRGMVQVAKSEKVAKSARAAKEIKAAKNSKTPAPLRQAAVESASIHGGRVPSISHRQEKRP